MDVTKITLDENELPKRWYNIAPETAHCVHGVVEEALRCRETGEEKVLFFCGSGHGDFDLVAYDDYLNGRIVDPEEPTEAIKRSISKLPEV